jgi:putative oxidoreductase
MAMTGLSRLAPLPLRLAAGASLCYDGYQKLFVDSIDEWVTTVSTFGLPESDLVAQIMAWGMLAGGALLILGFLTRLAALVNAVTFFIIIWKITLAGDIVGNLQLRFAGPDGYVLPMMVFAACLALLLSGAGALSVDGLLVGRRARSSVTVETD